MFALQGATGNPGNDGVDGSEGPRGIQGVRVSKLTFCNCFKLNSDSFYR